MKSIPILLLAICSIASADVIEVGDLNIIDDMTNSSHGLRFLDMSFSVGLDQAAALANAQATYADARLATPGEADDLIAAAGITYNGASTIEDGWDAGATADISTGANYDAGALQLKLGTTSTSGGGSTLFWTDPDGDSSAGSSRDFVFLAPSFLRINNSAATPAGSTVGWLIVSETAAVPEPSTFAVIGLAAIGLAGESTAAGRTRQLSLPQKNA